MSVFNKLVDHSSKFLLVIIGLTIGLLPIIHVFANQTLCHQGWNPIFEKYQHRLKQVEEVSSLQIGFIFHSNSSSKGSSNQVQDTLQLADFVSYTLQQKGEAVVRKNLETKAKRKNKRNQQTQETTTVTTLIENAPVAFLKKQISKFINFEHQSLKSKHWVIVSCGELETKIQQQIQSIKQKNPLYKFIIVSPKPISPLSVQSYKSKSVQSADKNSKGKKSKVKKVKVVEAADVEKQIQITQEKQILQSDDL